MGHHGLCTIIGPKVIWFVAIHPYDLKFGWCYLEYQGEDYKKSFQMATLQWRERYESGLSAYMDKTTPSFDAWRRV